VDREALSPDNNSAGKVEQGEIVIGFLFKTDEKLTETIESRTVLARMHRRATAAVISAAEMVRMARLPLRKQFTLILPHGPSAFNKNRPLPLRKQPAFGAQFSLISINCMETSHFGRFPSGL